MFEIKWSEEEEEEEEEEKKEAKGRIKDVKRQTGGSGRNIGRKESRKVAAPGSSME